MEARLIVFDKAYFDWFEKNIQDPGIHFGIADALHKTFPDNFPVLEVGCGRGYLTQHLHSLYGGRVVGVDISEYAIENPIAEGLLLYRDDISQEMVRAPDYRRYPLVLSWQLLEHMTGEIAADLAIENMSRLSSFIQVHSIALERGDDPTHYMIRPREWWISMFARHGWHVDPLLLWFFNMNMKTGPNPEIFVLRKGE